MVEFFALFIVLFLILSGSTGYYAQLHEIQEVKQQRKKGVKRKKNGTVNIIFLLIAIVILLVGMSIIITFFLSKSILFIYSGAITFVMLIASIYFLFNKPAWWIYSLLIATCLTALQLLIKNPTFGSCLTVFGFIGMTAYVMKGKIIPPKFIILFFILYTLYDFIGVYIYPIQPMLADKTINDVFPPAIQIGRTLLGNGDVLFALLMTAFIRTYYGLTLALIGAFLFSLPLIILGLIVNFFPKVNIAVPYLVLMTPFFLAIIFLMSKRGFRLI